MPRERYAYKGPQPTAADYEANRERMSRKRAAETQDRAELAEYNEAMRSGNEARAIEIALARRDRMRPKGWRKSEAKRSEQAGATDPLLAAPQTQGASSARPFKPGDKVFDKRFERLAKQLGVPVSKVLDSKTDIAELVSFDTPSGNGSRKWTCQYPDARWRIWETDLRHFDGSGLDRALSGVPSVKLRDGLPTALPRDGAK